MGKACSTHDKQVDKTSFGKPHAKRIFGKRNNVDDRIIVKRIFHKYDNRV